ncbi:antibiotic biosynthesis monooxygenase [Flavobacterium sp. W21_SRS_FM6]|uniref:antibiotic biosynthesis monooxygenase n=1 Tax=Flavobacterium sp. W21_SRS_FM6 TaxID=3240268 RepID=UPI003F938056
MTTPTPLQSDELATNGSAVSLIIRHKVQPVNQAAYELWLKQIIPAAAKFPGHQGVHVLRPAHGDNKFEIAVRFSSEKLAHNWLNSAERKSLLAESETLFHELEMLELYNGIDFWFTQSPAPNKVATRWKQWLLTTGVIWPLTMMVPTMLKPIEDLFVFSAHPVLRQGIVVAIVVAMVVYVIMPRLVRLTSSWLFR